METTNSFGYWIRRQRKALDLTQRALADKVGCSLAAIKKIEGDERRPSRQVAERMAEVLGVSANQHKIFLEVARGLRAVDQLSLVREPTIFISSRTSKVLHNLPPQLTSFIGRKHEIDEIKHLLLNTRLLTLIGTGKTRLSLQIA
jgi:transcriptional regulator with XRE-family HTH domain